MAIQLKKGLKDVDYCTSCTITLTIEIHKTNDMYKV